MDKDEQNVKMAIAVVVTLFLVAFGSYNIYYNCCIGKKFQLISVVLGVIPAIFAIYKFIMFYSDRSGSYTFLSSGLVVISILLIIVSVSSAKILNKYAKVNDFEAYSKVIKYEGYPSSNSLIKYFPKEVNKNSSTKEFCQWGDKKEQDYGMILTCSITKEELENKDFKDKLSLAKFKTISNDGVKEARNKLYVPSQISDKLQNEKDFEYYLMDASEVQDDGKTSGFSTGIIINYENSTITYYGIKCS